MKRIYWTDLLVGENSLYEFIENSEYKRYGFVISRMVVNALNLDDKLFNTLMGDKDYKILLEVERETEKSVVEPAIGPTQAYKPDVIIGIGGGSVIDAAKQLWLFLELPNLTYEDADKFYQLDKIERSCDLVAVPTTTGTGSEMTGCAMFNDDQGEKKMFLDHQLLPTVSILDASLVQTLPNRALVYSTVDALTHGLEAITNKDADAVSQFVGLQAVVTISNNLEKACNGDHQAREQLLVAASFAGIAINNANVGLSHTLNYPGEDFKLAHGLITGMITPYWVYYSKPDAMYETILRQLNQTLTEDSNVQLAKYLVELYRKVEMPVSLSELELDKEAYSQLIDTYVKHYLEFDQAYSFSKFNPDKERLTKLYESLYSGDIFRKETL